VEEEQDARKQLKKDAPNGEVKAKSGDLRLRHCIQHCYGIMGKYGNDEKDDAERHHPSHPEFLNLHENSI